MEKESTQKWDVVVKPSKGWFNVDIKNLWRYRDLIFLFVRRTFVAAYKQTILGPAWAIIQPFMSTVVYSLFFGDIAGLGADGIPNFVFFLAGNIMWGLFSGCLNSSASTFTSNSGIMGKVYFPRLVMPISSTLSQFISFFIQFAFLICAIVYFVVTGGNVHPNEYMLMLPLLLLQMALLGLGIGTMISSLTTKYRDLVMLIGFGVSLWSYCSPVAYDMFSRNAIMNSKWYNLYMLNPVTPVINIFRYGFIGCGEIDWFYYGISWIATFVFLFIGVILFSKTEKIFMDTV